MWGVIGIVASLALLIALAYRNCSVIVFAPLCALVAVLCDGSLPALAAYTQIFMPALGRFIAQYFPLFLLGAIFGKLMEASGCAASLSQAIIGRLGPRHAVLAVVLSCAVLTYGGVSLFVVVFTAFPLARALFRQANVPKRLIPGAIALGSFTFTMTAFPGTMQIQNLIPMPFFNTTSFAAPGLGLVSGVVMFAVGMTWLGYRVRSAGRRQEGYGVWEAEVEKPAEGMPSPPGWAAILPIACVIGVNFVCSQFWIATWDASYLSTPQFGATDVHKVRGIWSGIIALASATLALIGLHRRRLGRLNALLAEGATASLLPIFNTATEFGYGSTIKALAGFAAVQTFVVQLAPNNPLISEIAAVNAMAGITGSASGGLSIALEALGNAFLERSVAAGVDAELLHRAASIASGGFDSLPHNGAVITLLIVCGLTHRQSYLDIAVVSIVGPLAATVVLLLLASSFGCF